MQSKNNLASFIIAIILLSIMSGCSLDDQYHYTLSYRVANQTENLITGTLILDSTYYSNPAIEFEIDTGETIEMYTEDGGDGPNETPTFGYSLSTSELHINTNNSLIVIDVESNDKWERTTDRSTAIYTFFITEDLISK